MSEVISNITYPYLPKNIVDPVRTKYIDANIIPLSLVNIINEPLQIYNKLLTNINLRTKIINFHKLLIRVSHIGADVRMTCAHILPWACNMNTKCITCNEKVDLLNYSVLAISKYRIIIQIAQKIEADINYAKYRTSMNCCKLN